ncbi:TetR/AcrR family transcriptional regulator [Nocardia fusca]|uniref:TetR/AcrR family transcriptional regulator n=1 Tax=Nocardia fusca TaxID=941183 RepID=A0ABV3FI73_9NOCA
MVRAARARLIDSAVRLIRSRGVAGTAVSDLLADSGTARRSIYMHFPGGKAQLIEESVRSAGMWMDRMIEHKAAALPPAEMIRAFSDYWKQILTSSDYRSGCPVAAAAIGGHEVPEARAVAGEMFERWEHRLVRNAVAHGVPEPAATGFATMALAAMEGAVVMSLAAGSAEPLDRVSDQLLELLDHHLAEPVDRE